MKTTHLLATVATAFALALGGMALAQSRPNTSNQPIGYGADMGELTNTSLALRGRAEITQGQSRLRANAIEGARNAETGELTRIEASGDVYYVTPTDTIRGDRAVYTVADATVVVTGDVILRQGQNVLTGSRLSYNVDTGQARVEGDGQGGGRVRGVFYPEGSN